MNFPDYESGIPDDAVAALDPLHADAVCARLPAMNERADLSAVCSSLRTIIPTTEQIAAFDPLECLAAMRDIGILLGSVKRHGAEPVLAVPELEPALLELGARTDLVPRDTVHHYTCWNPRGIRQRMYTGDPQETHLIDSVRNAMPRLGAAVTICARLMRLDPADPAFAESMNVVADHLQAMVTSISDVVAQVSPVYFARGLRPYFEAITVAGTEYLGPAAANMPLALVDVALWASDHGHESYDCFHRESISYSLPPWRRLYADWQHGPSLAKVISAAIADDDQGPPRAAAEALCRALRVLIVFRGKHVTIARRAYEEEVGLYREGSGGGTVELLARILRLTRDIAAAVGVHHQRPAAVVRRSA
ncbi:monodechloroaminopyrrolnitrin synthase PrnB family protein [Amycolatopsis japonica]